LPRTATTSRTTRSGNITAGLIFVSYNNALFGDTMDMEFDRYVQNNYFHDNTLSNNGADGQGILAGVGADIVVDGCTDPDKDYSVQQNCIQHSGTPSFSNVNLCEAKPALELSDFDCKGKTLAGQNP
jgi:hypothetical protein